MSTHCSDQEALKYFYNYFVLNTNATDSYITNLNNSVLDLKSIVANSSCLSFGLLGKPSNKKNKIIVEIFQKGVGVSTPIPHFLKLPKIGLFGAKLVVFDHKITHR